MSIEELLRVAQQLIDKLESESAAIQHKKEGIALFYNALVEAQAKKEKADSDMEEAYIAEHSPGSGNV